jgi:hypothetical protein
MGAADLTLIAALNFFAICFPTALALAGIAVAFETTKLTTLRGRFFVWGGLVIFGLLGSGVVYWQQTLSEKEAAKGIRDDVAGATEPLRKSIQALQRQVNLAVASTAARASPPALVIPSASTKKYPLTKPATMSPAAVVPASGQVGHIQFVQRSMVSTNTSEPYAAQIISRP